MCSTVSRSRPCVAKHFLETFPAPAPLHNSGCDPPKTVIIAACQVFITLFSIFIAQVGTPICIDRCEVAATSPPALSSRQSRHQAQGVRKLASRSLSWLRADVVRPPDALVSQVLQPNEDPQCTSSDFSDSVLAAAAAVPGCSQTSLFCPILSPGPRWGVQAP